MSISEVDQKSDIFMRRTVCLHGDFEVLTEELLSECIRKQTGHVETIEEIIFRGF